MLKYVSTAQKATVVTHSCYGHFTGVNDRNLIIAKGNRLEINLVISDGLQHVSDVPVHGKVSALELLRLKGKEQDVLFIATQFSFSIVDWDADTSSIRPRLDHRIDVDNSQIRVVDPELRCIGVHCSDGLFTLFPIDDEGKLGEATPLEIRLEKLKVLDIKFLFCCLDPTFVVLYQDEDESDDMSGHIRIYKASIIERSLDQEILLYNVDAHFLIPVPPPMSGVLTIGKRSISHYFREDGTTLTVPMSIKTAYGRLDGDGRYLLGADDGLLYLLEVIHEGERVTELKLRKLVLESDSIASAISYLDDDLAYIGSSYGDSQLVRLNIELCTADVRERYFNPGAIIDFSVVDLGRLRQGQVVTCSGAKNSTLQVLWNGICTHEEMSLQRQYEGITRMWSLRATNEQNYTFLILGFDNEIRILRLIPENMLVDAEIEGFLLHVLTLFCGDMNSCLVQVTEKNVRVVDSTTGKLKDHWVAKSGVKFNIATANATQVLLASGCTLTLIEVDDKPLKCLWHRSDLKLDNQISCIDISPLGESASSINFAAVRMWDRSVRIYSLPDLDFITQQELDGIVPRSVKLCSFEGISYLLCGSGAGKLLEFSLVMNTGVLEDMEKVSLEDKKEVSLGATHVTLCAFSFNGATRVIAVSNTPTVIYRNNKLRHGCLDLKDVTHMCPLASGDCFAIAKVDGLAIVTLDEVQKLQFRSIRLEEHACCISHQEQTHTYAICCVESDPARGDARMHVRLLDENLEIMSTYDLGSHGRPEYGCSILSCSFSDDSSAYYCVGTSGVSPGESERGQILVLKVVGRTLQLIANKETDGAVYTLNAFSGKLLASVNEEIQLYSWAGEPGNRMLQLVCTHTGRIRSLYVQTHGNSIIVGDLMESISLLSFQNEMGGAIVERAHDVNAKWMSAVVVLDEETYVGADQNFNLFTVRRNEVAAGEQHNCLEVVDGYQLGELVTRVRHGSLAVDAEEATTIIFGTASGLIGIMASLPEKEYSFLYSLQTKLRGVIQGVGGLLHFQWRTFYNDKEWPENFVDGDLIESFLGLSDEQKEAICKGMDRSVEEISKEVEELSFLSSGESRFS